ncbi:MAG: HAMP domain-containing histidine kinase [Lachnospiraceae bacterium]|nr:HAMP domain-containing histidine kinase [Lachnospiraceae bacterium]
MKKKKLFSIPAKIITIVVLAISAFLAGLAAMRIAQGYWIGMTFSEMAHGSFYNNSTAAASYLYREGSSILATLQDANSFCRDGASYDETETIDIMNLDAGVVNENKNPETTYALADLDAFYGSDGYALIQYLVNYGEELTYDDFYTEEMYTDTAATEEADSGTTVVEAEIDADATEAASEFAQEEMGSDATLLGTENVTVDSIAGSDADESHYTYETISYIFGIYGNLANVLYNNGIVVEEDYIVNAAGETLAEYARENQDSISILDCYKKLIAAADALDEYLSGASDSNAMLYVRNISTDDVYTNIEEWRDLTLDEVRESYLESMGGEGDGTYYAYSENEWASETETDMVGSVDGLEYYGDLLLEEVRSSGVGYYQIFLGLDLNYPLRTSSSYTTNLWFAGWNNHNIFEPFSTVTVFFLALAAMAAMLVLAALQTGRRPDDPDIHPVPMDRFPLEFMMIGDIVLWVLLIAWLYSQLSLVYSDVLYSDVTYISANVVGGAFSAALIVLLSAWEWKRYGRRVRERSVGGSLILIIVRKVRKSLETGRGAEAQIRCMVGIYWIFIVVQAFFLLLGARLWWSWYSPGVGVFLMLVLIVVDLIVMIRLIRQTAERTRITKGMEELAAGNLDYQVDAVGFTSENRGTADVFNSVREGIKHAVEVEMKSERLKTDLITNVSHDIKTPLTSIINYVDILKRENFEDERIAGYIDVLDRKSQRLKQLTDDLVEASKISSGVITLDIQEINLKQLLLQAIGEFDEKFQERNLSLVIDLTEAEMRIQADGRRMYRVIENLLNNAVKYSMPGSRVYVSGVVQDRKVSFTIKNMSEQALNFSAEELTERFVRGDVSRTTEGSGLGLEIAKNLTAMQGGDLQLYLDGDLFKVTVSFYGVPV